MKNTTTKDVKESVSDKFKKELNTEEKEIFEQLKTCLINSCDAYEFEAVTEDNLEDYAALITYIKNGVIKIEQNGISVKLRKALKNEDGSILTESVKILFERNESREDVFTNGIKTGKKASISDNKQYMRAVIAASLENVGSDMKLIGKEAVRKIHQRDYQLLLTCYTFFRS